MDLGSGIRDPGSGKNLFRIPDPGVQKAPDPGSGSATLIESVQLAHLRNSNLSKKLQSKLSISWNPTIIFDCNHSASRRK
jgi:hypothetical protein